MSEMEEIRTILQEIEELVRAEEERRESILEEVIRIREILEYFREIVDEVRP